MPGQSAAMELKVLISILQSGTALQTLLGQTKQLTDALTKLQQQAGKTPEAVKDPVKTKPVDDATRAFRSLDSAVSSLVTSLKFLAGGFLALESVRFLKDLADTAARAEVLSTVLHVVGNNAGYTTEALDKADRQIQALGVTASASRQGLTQFIQAELDLAKAPELARAAQDAAVILGVNSSEAFSRLVTAVQTSNTLMLRHMGIIVSADAAYQTYAQSIGKSVTQLTSAQRATAFLNATLVQTARIQGSYVAAMGDVGKQLQSLDRFTQDLKQSLGNSLLPAYLALVEELTLFTQHMKLAADEMYGQGEGAKKLGEDIRSIAKALRVTIEFVIDHRKEIAVLAGWWLFITKLAIPLITAFFRLKDAIAGIEGGLLGRFILGVGRLGFGLIALGITLISLTIYSERFNAAMGSIVGVVWMASAAFGTLGGTISGAVVAGFKTLMNMVLHPLSPSEWIKPWKDWAAGVVERINYIKEIWENTKARFQVAIGAPDPSKETPQEAARAARAKRFTEEAELLTAVVLKTHEYNELKNKGSAEEIKRTEKELEAMKKKAAAMTEARKAEQDALKMGKGAKELEDERLKINIQQNLENALTKKLEDARKGAKFTYTPAGELISMQFSAQISQFTDLLDIYNTAGNKAKIQTSELLQNFRESAGVTKTRGELTALKTALDDLIKAGVSPDVLKNANIAYQTAIRQVRDETLRQSSVLEKEREAHFRQSEKQRADNIQNELDMLQSANQLAELADEQSYSRRGMDLDEYFNRKRARLTAEYAKEIEKAENQVAALEAERQKNIPKTPEELEDLQTKLNAARAALDLLRSDTGTQAVKIAKLESDREDARIQRETKAKQTIMDIAAIYGDEETALAAVNNKYDEQYNKANTQAEREAAQAERRKAIFETELKYRERRLDLELQEQRVIQDNLALTQAVLDVRLKHVQASVDLGEISETEAIRQRNAIRLEQIAHDEALAASKSVELQRLKTELVREEAKIREDMAGKDEADIQARLNTELEARRQKVQGLTIEITNLNGAIEDSTSKIETYSKKIKDSFTDSFSSALTEMTIDFHKAGEIWKGVAQQLQREIVGIFAKAFTRQLFQKLSFAWIDSAMHIGAGGRGGGGASMAGTGEWAEGGVVSGPGTGTSDSVIARVSTGEHIMPAAKAARWMPLLEGIRLGTIMPRFAAGGLVQSIAIPSVIPRRYAGGGVVVSDAGAAAVTPGGGGPSHMTVTLHPDTMNMTMREWLEHEAVRQYGRR